MSEASNGGRAPSGQGLSEPIAIIGMSSLFPQAESLREYWSNIKRGVDSITDLPESHWQAGDYFDADPKRQDHVYTTRGGFLPLVPFNPIEFGVTPTSMEAIDTSQLLGLLVAHGALVDAGYGPKRDFDRQKVSVILGVTGALELTVTMGARLGHPVWRDALAKAGVHPQVIDDVVQSIGDSYVAWQEDTFPGLLGNVVAGRISNRLDLGGTNCVVDAACASSLSAAHLAMLELASGRADMAITGGVDTFNDIFMYSCFGKTLALSKSGDIRPFDASADGTILGEGVGMVVLKRLADAERDGDRIYAVVRGIGSSSDGRGKAIYAPSAEGQERALREAYRQAGITPDTIGLVEAHGTGTKVGDATEARALAKIFREARETGVWCALGSVKSQIGHTKAAAGVAGMIKVALALRHKVIPPTIKITEPNPAIDLEKGPFYLPTRKRPWISLGRHPRRAAVSALGFGGTNFHVVLEEHKAEKAEVDWDGRVQIVALSAETLEELRGKLAEFLAGDFDWRELSRRATRSRRDFSSRHAFRLIQVLERDKHAPKVLLERLRERLEMSDGERMWSTPEGAFFGRGSRLGKLGFLFPGQGSQYVGMCLDLACVFPQMQGALTEADVAFGDLRDVARQLSDFIYPPHVFGLDADKLNELALRATDVAQPAIGAVSMGALSILMMFGVFPAAAAGHSYGELMALFAGGRIDAPTLLHLSKLRGELMAQGEGDRGAMIAVRASAEAAQEVIDAEQLDLIVANRNGPEQVVLSGRTEEVERAGRIFGERKLAATRLPVSAAFHSALVAAAQEPFRRALENVNVGPAGIDVYSNTTAGVYPADPAQVREILGGQLARPVEFVSEIEAMAAAGVQTFVEVGPGGKMTALVRAILGDREHAAFAIDRSAGRNNGVADLACALAQIASLGHEIDLTAWEGGRVGGEVVDLDAAPAPGGGLKIMLNGANYRRVKPGEAGGGSGRTPHGNGKTNLMRAPDTSASSPSGGSLAAALPALDIPAASHQAIFAPPPQAAPASIAAKGPATPPPVAAFAPAPSRLRAPAPSHRALAEALQSTQDSLIALQRLQQQTADLHRKFLEGQEEAQRSFQQLIARQEQLFAMAMGGAAPQAASVSYAIPQAPPVPRPAAPVASPAPPAPRAVRDEARKAEPARPEFTAILLEVVAEKTGYPAEMLNVAMDMESDLGIDSIKRVEILSSLQERLPQLPTIEPERLGTLRTLADVVAYMDASGASSAPAFPPSAPAAPAAPALAPAASGDLAALLLSVVGEKTGYPAEMLSLEMDMESDLGIDSIKRVEILSEMQERLPDAPVPAPEELGSLRTLADVVAFLGAGIASAAPVVPAPISNGAAAHSNGSSNGNGTHADEIGSRLSAAGLRALLLDVVAEKTGYPADMLRLDMEMESDLGIDSIKRVEILSELQERLPDAPVVEPDDIGSLRTLQQIIDYLAGSNHAATAPAPAAHGDRGMNGVSHAVSIPSAQARADAPASTSSAFSIPPAAVELRRTVLAPVAMERVERGEAVVPPVGAEIFVLDDGGELGARITQALGAAGLNARLVESQQPEILRASAVIGGLIVVSSARPPAQGEPWDAASPARMRAAFEAVQAAGAGLRNSGRLGGAFLATVSRMDGCFGLAEDSADFDPVQGAFAGLVKTAAREWPEVSCRAIDVAVDWPVDEALAAVIVEEALQRGPVETGFSAEGRIRLEEVETLDADGADGSAMGAMVEPGDVVVVSGGARGVTAETALALAAACQPTLVILGRTPAPESEPDWLRTLESEAAIKRTLLERANGSAPTPKQLQQQYQAIAASRELAKNLARLEAAGSRVIYRSVDLRDAAAVERILDEVRAEAGPIRGIIHGAGVLADRRIEEKTLDQYDAVVSTKLEGLGSLLRATRRDPVRALAFFSSSTARYGRVGQVDYAMANEALNKIAQREAKLRPACRVVSFNWGPWAGGMVTPALEQVFAAEGVGLIPLKEGGRFLVAELGRSPLDVEVIVGAAPAAATPTPAPRPALRTAFELDADLESLPILAAHVIDGRPVLPVALMIEWFAHAALHENPGLRFQGLDDLRVLKGVKLSRASASRLRVSASRARREGDHWEVEAQLTGGERGETLHARATVRLGDSPLAAPGGPIQPAITDKYPRLVRESYREVLFHGPELQGIDRIIGWSSGGISGSARTAGDPAGWMRDPLRSEWLTEPLAIDCALQLLILWTYEQHGQASLPSGIGRYRQFVSDFGESVEIAVRATSTKGSLVRADIDFISPDGVLLARIEDCEHVMNAGLIDAFARVDTLADPIA